MALSPYETQAIFNLQRYLRQLSRFDPDIPTVDEDGIFGEATRRSLPLTAMIPQREIMSSFRVICMFSFLLGWISFQIWVCRAAPEMQNAKCKIRERETVR